VSKKSIENSINDYVRGETKGKSFPTGWVIVASLAPPAGDTGSGDSYLTLSSEGLPVHTQLGLLELAQTDVKNMSLVSMIDFILRGRNGRSDKR
jgi:hypothetical protein